MGTAIDIRHATLKIEGNVILHDLSWSVERGERWFILGPNGAGKTTLVKLILGLVWPLFGAEVTVLGNRYGRSDIMQVRKKIAWASPFMQSWTAENDLTVRDVVLSGLDSTIGFYREPSKEELRRCGEVLSMLGAEALSGKPFTRISSGEQVKALIGRCLIARPELLILDETCVHLDLWSREILLSAIDSIACASPETTMIFVTQRIEEITKTFERGLILGRGRIAIQGKRDEILTPQHLSEAFNGLKLELRQGPDGRFWPFPLR